MHTKNLALFALSASAVFASPFHKRQTMQHSHFHGTGFHLRPTGTGTGIGHFHTANSTDGPFAPPSSSMMATVTMTVSPLPQESNPDAALATAAANLVDTANAVEGSTTSCTSTSIATETSVRFITVTANDAELGAGQAAHTIEATSQVSAGQFWGSKSSGGAPWSYSQPANSFAPSQAQPSTTFATMASTAKASSASASPSAMSSSTPSTGSSSGKKGISFNSASLVGAFSGSVSWAYNWGTGASGLPSGLEYVPMCWGSNQVSGFASQIGSATHVLSFNEPDLAAQANMDPQTAAAKHKQVFSSLQGKVQIGSPAVTNGATTSPPMGVNWLDQFFTACGSNCPVDFVAYHWYNTAQSIDDFKTHTQDIINVAAKHGVSKVWLTEFAPSGSAADQASFMSQAVDFLDSTAAVERYAAFMASDGTLLSGSSLNNVGSAYAAAA